MKTNLFCSLLLLLVTTPSFCQTYFGLGVGYDFVLIKKGDKVDESPGEIFIRNDKNTVGGIHGSLFVEQRISKVSYLSLSGTVFSRRDVIADWPSVLLDPESIRFKFWQVNLGYKHINRKNLYVGGGLGIRVNSLALNYGGFQDDISPWIPNNTSYIMNLSLGYNFKKFLFELEYQKGIAYKDDYDYFIKPIDIYGAKVMYYFSIGAKQRAETYFGTRK